MVKFLQIRYKHFIFNSFKKIIGENNLIKSLHPTFFEEVCLPNLFFESEGVLSCYMEDKT